MNYHLLGIRSLERKRLALKKCEMLAIYKTIFRKCPNPAIVFEVDTNVHNFVIFLLDLMKDSSWKTQLDVSQTLISWIPWINLKKSEIPTTVSFLFLTPYLLSYNILKLILWTDIYNCKKIMIKSYLNVLSFTSYWHHIHICIIIKRIIIVNASFTSLRNWGILWT